MPAKPAVPGKKAVAAKPAAPAKKAPAAKAAPAKAAAKPTVAKSSAAERQPVPAKKARSKAAAGAKAPAAQPAPVARPAFAPRPVGKVAKAVIAKPAAPVVRAKVKVIPYKTDKDSGRPILPEGYKPSADEEYMGPLQTEYFRQRLMGWREDLVEESKQTIENLKEEVRDVGDEAERATRETENSLELRTRDRYRKLIGKIDSTLKRLDSGEYGFSVDSGEEIGLERLEARLTAERTIDEQERWEHLQKQIGD